MNKNKTGLGRGLSALIPPASEEMNKEAAATEIKVSAIVPNSFQPRRTFDEGKLAELAESIKAHGVVQPIVVRKITDGKYELVVGERRLRACQSLKLPKVPALIKEYTDEQMMEIALIENIQRQDLNPVEEAAAYKRLLEEFKFTQVVAQKISKSRSSWRIWSEYSIAARHPGQGCGGINWARASAINQKNEAQQLKAGK